MRHLKLLLLLCLPFTMLPVGAQGQTQTDTKTIADKTAGMQTFDGYFKFYWDEKSGKIWLEVDKWNTEFLYVNSLTEGLGSNDIGLDRNQLGGERIVKFMRNGPKVMLLQPNYDYRAISNNADERKSVEQAFAKSVIWGFKVEAEENGKVLIDLTPFLLRDAHGVMQRLTMNNQGTYRLDESRSAISLDRTKNFPKNSEFEAMITFTGEPRGGLVRSVTPSADAITLQMHHSFVELPDGDYQPRMFDPRAGYFGISYADYATPIDQPLVKRFISRHRLKKKNPNAKVSEAVEPIIYYVDRGTPEPIRSALIEGASWWNQAYEAAGYKDAFQVKVLPEGADPMDVRYNMINWVHRSTRGWSYGSTVTDPRTGEIIKGHVLLGSLRVRQDFLIAQGLIDAYAKGETPDPRMEQMALARLRQLSAHEVGHTLGLQHNFAASVNDRASVMDYPHPYVTFDANGNADFSKAYAVGIGEFDKRSILYGYQDFPKGTDEKKALLDMLDETYNKMNLLYLTDQDGRPQSSANPYTHLWDNGKDPASELCRLLDVRKMALSKFSEKNIPIGAPMATLENVLVPLYLSHRYQVEGASKVIGGYTFDYGVRGANPKLVEMISDQMQRDALNALMETLQPSFLALPESILKLIPPQPPSYSRDRELFKVYTGNTFDPLAAAESSANHTISMLLNPQRLARVVEQHARDSKRLSLPELLDQLMAAVQVKASYSEYEKEIARMTEKLVLHHLLNLAGDDRVLRQVAAVALSKINEMEAKMDVTLDPAQVAHLTYLHEQIAMFKRNPKDYKVPYIPEMPDGQPIGAIEEWGCGH